MLSKLSGLIVGREPVMFSALVSAVTGLAVAFGVDISAEKLAAINAAVVAAVGFAARMAVTPTAKEDTTSGPRT